jgi:hypothetical protein
MSVPQKVLKSQRLLKFKIPCAFNGQMSDVEIYLGNPEEKHNPIFFQNKYISDVKGGVIPEGVLASLEELKKLAKANGVDFLDLCKEALTSIANQDKTLPDDKKVIEDEAAKDLNKETSQIKVDEKAQASSQSLEVAKNNLELEKPLTQEARFQENIENKNNEDNAIIKPDNEAG